MSPDDPRHGEERGYFAHRKMGERPCDPCTVAHRAAQKRRTLRVLNGSANWMPAIGTQRRIQALVAIGWRLEDIAAAAGHKRTHETMSSVLRKQTRVRAQTAAHIAQVYDRLSGKPGPSSRVRVNARKRGWAPPLAWEGIDIDDPLAQPWQPEQQVCSVGRTSLIEALVEDFDWLVSQGESEQQAAERLGIRLDSFKDQRRRFERQEVA
ncbi:hypothetical protein [Nocardioides sp. BYT-33-1]|uniref:hypothetical protein n=1 Tax=Nocardioides sp. BYT-33-1 TaxID=3416952 RepID=UPI003F534047